MLSEQEGQQFSFPENCMFIYITKTAAVPIYHAIKIVYWLFPNQYPLLMKGKVFKINATGG